MYHWGSGRPGLTDTTGKVLLSQGYRSVQLLGSVGFADSCHGFLLGWISPVLHLLLLLMIWDMWTYHYSLLSVFVDCLISICAVLVTHDL